ncbi:MAG: flagellar basal body L-ring protein FlgH [Bdellovibrionota bacterium]
MKFGLSFFVGAWVMFTLTGCGDMINSLRRESREADQQEERDRAVGEDGAQGGYQPKTLRGLSANNTPEFDPPAARSYGRHLTASMPARAADAAQEAPAEEENYHRATRDDFVDKAAHENSLWDGQGQNNYLFANNRRRESGDVITADVEKELRREIQYQLYMTLPPEQRKVRKPSSAAAAANPSGTDSVTNAAGAPNKDGKAPDKGADAKGRDAAEEAAKTNMAPTKDDDVIRMEVVENMGNGMMRVLGQKRVVYRGVSRIVEVAALVNTKDVDDGNHTKSSTFLDTKAQVIQ